jgi:hypothetical protein
VKKNIAIAVLSISTLVLALVCVGQFANNAWHAAAMRAAEWKVRTSGYQVWSRACAHASEGSAQRAKWCEWAAKETVRTAAESGVTDEDIRVLATDAVLRDSLHPSK